MMQMWSIHVCVYLFLCSSSLYPSYSSCFQILLFLFPFDVVCNYAFIAYNSYEPNKYMLSIQVKYT